MAGGRRRQKMRVYWEMQLPATCPRCGQTIHPWHKWDMGHILPMHRYPQLEFELSNTRPEHARCNRADGAHITHHRPRQVTQPAPVNW